MAKAGVVSFDKRSRQQINFKHKSINAFLRLSNINVFTAASFVSLDFLLSGCRQKAQSFS